MHTPPLSPSDIPEKRNHSPACKALAFAFAIIANVGIFLSFYYQLDLPFRASAIIAGTCFTLFSLYLCCSKEKKSQTLPDQPQSRPAKKTPKTAPKKASSSSLVSLEEKSEPLSDGLSLKTSTLTLKASLDPKKFQSWVEKRASPQHKAIFRNTILTVPLPQEGDSLTYHQVVENDPQAFQMLMKAKLQDFPVQTNPHWMDFTLEGHSYNNFANGQVNGGGWKSHGNVQEERLFQEFPQLSWMDYLLQSQGKTLLPTHGRIGVHAQANPTPHIIEATRTHKISPDLYGQSLGNYQPKDIPQHISEETLPPVRITATAAQNWRECRAKKYDKSSLLYHLKAAYFACMAEKHFNPDDPIFISGLWGCGVFGNSEKTISLILMTAAAMAGVQLELTGCAEDNPHYNPQWVQQMQAFIQNKTPEEILDYILKHQAQDPSWGPRT